jgi:lipopolysaccharide export system ATP-binding protein
MSESTSQTSDFEAVSPDARGLVAEGLVAELGRRWWPPRPPRRVVNGLSLRVGPGECVGLLGPNGAGKTTTFRMLTGLLQPAEGRVRLDGADLTAWPLWRRARAGLGYLPQGASIFRRLTVTENLALALERHLPDRQARLTEASALLAAHGLTHLAQARGDRLSGGERRRVEIVRALAARPRVLLVDEPFAGLDPPAVSGVVQTLRGLVAEGVGVLLTDHHARHALEACDRIYILADGLALFAGTPAAAVADAQVQARYLGKPSDLR